MTKAALPNTAPLSAVQQAAAEILALVNSSPRTPWPAEIEAIVAKVSTRTASVAHYDDEAIDLECWDAAEQAHALVASRDGGATDAEHDAANDAAISETLGIWAKPVTVWSDIVARAKISLFWRWPKFDQTEGGYPEYLALVAAEAASMDDWAHAHLLHAILHFQDSAGRAAP